MEEAAEAGALADAGGLIAQLTPALDQLLTDLRRAAGRRQLSLNGQWLPQDGRGPDHLNIPPGGQGRKHLAQVPDSQ